MKNKTVQIFQNQNARSQEVYEILKAKLLEYGFIIVEKNAELNIAIGGDGAFIRMLKKTNYNVNTYYVGINTGTLGFLQEVEVSEIDMLLESIQLGQFKICQTAVQKTIIETKDKKYIFYSFNEIIVRKTDLGILKVDVDIEGENTERLIGDALIICTSVGSTAHASSYGAAIVHESLHTLQLISVGAFNSIVNQTLKSPLVLQDTVEIELYPLEQKNELLIIVDGENFAFLGVTKITTAICKKKVKRLRLQQKNFYQKIKSKFIDLEKERK